MDINCGLLTYNSKLDAKKVSTFGGVVRDIFLIGNVTYHIRLYELDSNDHFPDVRPCKKGIKSCRPVLDTVSN